MRKIYMALSGLLLLAIVVQFYFAAVGAFTKPQTDTSYALHSLTGMAVIPGLSVLATIAAALARAPGRLIVLTIVPFGLVIVQVLIIVIGEAFNNSTGDTSPVGLAIMGLHALNGIVLAHFAVTVFSRSLALAKPADAA